MISSTGTRAVTGSAGTGGTAVGAAVPALELVGAGVHVPEGTVLLHPVDWVVAPGEHWLVLGGNGAGKSTMLSLASAARRPSTGTVTVTGQRLGRVDMRDLRALLGRVDGRLAERFGPRATGRDVVLTGATGTTERLRSRERPEDADRAEEVMALLHAERLADRLFATCSTGERQRLLIARALVPRPRLLLLDEPSTGLDFVARETLLRGLQALAAAEPALATVLVTHHLEDVPSSTTHALLLREGRVLRQGPVGDVLTGSAVSECYGTPVEVSRWHGRWRAVAVPDGAAPGPGVGGRAAGQGGDDGTATGEARVDGTNGGTSGDTDGGADGGAVEVRDHADRSRFVAQVDGEPAGFAEYRRDGDLVVMTHTVVDDAFAGRGVGGALARTALDDARGRGLRVDPQCSFVRGWIEEHPDYADLVA